MFWLAIGITLFLLVCFIGAIQEKHGQPIIVLIMAGFLNIFVRPIAILMGWFSGLKQLRKQRQRGM